MPRSSRVVSDVPQRQSPRLRMSSTSDSDRSSTKVGGDRRSPRGTQSDPVNQKKLGTRIADLESQLGQAQDELRCLKDQLASAIAAKKAAQEQLETKSKKPNKVKVKRSSSHESSKKEDSSNTTYEAPDESLHETDVFEVTVEPEVELKQSTILEDPETAAVDLAPPPVIEETEKPFVDELAAKNDEIGLLKSRVEEEEDELELSRRENESLKSQLSETSVEISSARVKEKEMKLRLKQIEQELEADKVDAVEMNKKLEASEKARAELETEMKKLRAQTEQWRKAADAAAVILAGGGEMNNETRLPERCGSMDKHYGGANNFFQHPPAFVVGSPGWADDSDYVYGSGKRKGGSGIRMFGDFWKKKGQK